jgi:hypothetical protein
MGHRGEYEVFGGGGLIVKVEEDDFIFLFVDVEIRCTYIVNTSSAILEDFRKGDTGPLSQRKKLNLLILEVHHTPLSHLL